MKTNLEMKAGPHRGQRGGSRAALVVLGAWLTVAACGHVAKMQTPAPDGPKISALEFLPDRTIAGCPATLRFHFEAPAGEIVRAIGAWTLEQDLRKRTADSGYVVLAVDPGAFSGKKSGEVIAPMTFARYGTYWYSVQVQDRAGRWSNVENDAIVVAPPLSGGLPNCQ